MKSRNLAGTTALLALIAGTAATADVTPEEVWQNWQDLGTAAGQTITAGAVNLDGDTLVVEDVTTAYAKDGATVEATIDEINFLDLGDGTVEVTMSDSYPIEMTLPAEAGKEGATPTDISIEVSQPGLEIIVGGSTSETSYEFTAPTLGIKIVSIEGVDAAAIDLTFDITMSGVDGSYMVAGETDAKTLDSTLNLQSMALVVIGADPETQSDFNVEKNTEFGFGKMGIPKNFDG